MERKNIRLDLPVYSMGNVYSLTIGTFSKRCLFLNKDVANAVQGAIHEIHSVDHAVIVYAIMPDHLHLLMRTSPGCSIIRVIKSFKQKIGFWHAKMYKQPLWQKSFYDHIIRDEAGIENVISYVLNNPVRKGLVVHWQDYPYIGSGVWSRKELEGVYG